MPANLIKAPNGSDDTATLIDAINAKIKSGYGGKIILDEGIYQTTEKLNLSGLPILVHGQGGVQPLLEQSSIPPTLVKWIGADVDLHPEDPNEGQAIFAVINTQGCQLMDFALDCGGLAGSGYVLYGATYFQANVHICNFKGYGVQLVSSPTSDTAWFDIWGSAFGGKSGAYIDGGGTYNTCLGNFHGFNVQRCTEVGFECGDCDNINFYDIMTPGYEIPEVPGVKFGVWLHDPAKARDLYFNHVQAGSRWNSADPIASSCHAFWITNAHAAGFDKDFMTTVIGYSRSNGEGPIETDGDPVDQFIKGVY